MPTLLRVDGYRFFFFSRENNEPPHIHIESAENYAKYWLDPVFLAKSGGYSAKELNKLRRIVEDNVDSFKERWYEYFNINR